MKIRCKLERRHGTQVRLGDTDYDFQPESEGGPHVCHVADEAHAARFLEIAEAYELADVVARNVVAMSKAVVSDEPRKRKGK